MERIKINDLYVWQFKSLSDEKRIKHFVTDRSADESEGEFTLSFSSHPDRKIIIGNRLRIANALNIDMDRLVLPSQVHGTRIVRVTGRTRKEELSETDALVTNERGICIAVMSADCVPVLLFDRRNAVVAAIHSGWRGTVAKIVEKTVMKLNDEFGTKAEDIVAAIGPSVCQDSYEVGEEVIEEFVKNFSSHKELLVPTTNGKAKLDLWKANQIQLCDNGVLKKNIELPGLCTVKNNGYFFSARKGDKGRFAAGIMLS